MKRFLLAVPALLLAQQGQFLRFTGPKGELLIQNLTSFTVDNLIGSGHFTANGSPVQIFWKDAGVTASANSIEGETGVDAESHEYFLKSGIMAGGATTTIDSDAAYSYLVQRAQAGGTQP